MGGHDRQCLGSDWLWFCVLSLETVSEGQEHVSLASGMLLLGQLPSAFAETLWLETGITPQMMSPTLPSQLVSAKLGWPAERDEDGEGKQSKAWKVAQRG